MNNCSKCTNWQEHESEPTPVTGEISEEANEISGLCSGYVEEPK